MPEEKKQQENVEDIFSSTETAPKQSNIFKEMEAEELPEEKEISEVVKTPVRFFSLNFFKQKNKKVFVLIGAIVIILILLFLIIPKIKEIKNKRKIEKNLEKNAITQLQTGTIEQLIENIDSDKDGLSNKEEAQLGTNPLKVDSDNDGLSDRAEVKAWKTNPLNSDTDKDKINDGDEIRKKLNPKGEGSLLDTIKTNQQ
ncbi:MAG: thrombospondin type 3 repeat-containing protein [Candidatus Kuenenbacteria bacterium]